MVRRLRADGGFMLPLALGIMLVLSIAVFAIIEFSSANTRTSSLNERRQSAKALAEAAVNHGASRLAKELSNDAGYSGTPSDTANVQGTSIPWSTTLVSSSPKTWLVTATATLPNPTGPGASAVPRVVSAQFTWSSYPDPSVWRGLTLFNQGTTPLMSDDDASIVTPVYSKGDLRITQGKYLGNSLQVYGKLTIEGSADVVSIGASVRPGTSWKSTFPAPFTRAEHRVADFRVKDGCGNSTSGPWTAATCSTTSATGGSSGTPLAGKIWLTCPSSPCSSTNITSSAFSSTVENVPEPSVDFTAARNTAHLRPTQGCQTSSGAPPSFSSTSDVRLMTGSAYTCRRDVDGDGTIDAELSWTPGSPGTLTVKGIMYFDGPIKQDFDNRWGRVVGKAIVYTDQYILLKGVNSGLCGVTLTTQPKCDNAPGVWEPATTPNFLVLIAKSTSNTAIDQAGFTFQGGLMAPNGGYVSQGNSEFKGAITADKAELKNEGIIDAWSPFTAGTEIPGLPGSINKLSFVPGSWNG